tara:strand:+ start:331 stop:489 length:159 start_codon:yes stop_codon:yes gene_type:complete
MSRAELNTKLPSKIMLIISKDLRLGTFWVQAFLGVIYYWLRLIATTNRGDTI